MHYKCREPCCPQGFNRNTNGVCQQICRGCQTGVCIQGECYGELCVNKEACSNIKKLEK